MTKQILTVLDSGSVIDRSVLVSASVTEIQSLIETVPSGHVLVVADASSFFTSDNLLKLIEANDLNYKLVAEQAGLNISEQEVAAMQRAVALRAEITKNMKPALPPYPFLPVSDDFDLAANHVNIGKHQVSRNGFRTSLANVRLIWAHASKAWAANTYNTGVPCMYINADYTQKAVYIHATEIRIGCQIVPRYLAEQIALKLELPFPE